MRQVRSRTLFGFYLTMQENQIKLGLRENLPQFLLLVIVNAYVGGMVGIERSIMPLFASTVFHIQAKAAVLSFITVFGISKAVSNYFSGKLAGEIGRKNVLVLGWILALPIPFLMIYATSWTWVVWTNVLLGIHQGLAWSSTVVMKIDLVGEKQRGFAMGLNEFAGYLSVAAIAMLTAFIAQHFGVSPFPFYVGIVLAILGLFTTIFFVRDTTQHTKKESQNSIIPRLQKTFSETTWKHPVLSSVSQAGLVNNLNDGMVWGLLPVILAQQGFQLKSIGIIAAIYPAFWGVGQLITGKMADLYSKKSLLFWGMFLQGLTLLFMPVTSHLIIWVILSAILGIGTALVYPTFLATIAQFTHPADRANALGIFRFWRDLGYAFGAVITGFIADKFGVNISIYAIALITLLSAFMIQIRFKENGK